MPFVQHTIEPKYLSRANLWDEDGKPRITDGELEAVTNNTLSNALRQLASLVLVANDIFTELGDQLKAINERSESLKIKIGKVEERATAFDPKKVTVPEGDICTFALLKEHYETKRHLDTKLFSLESRPATLQALYQAAAKTPVNIMRQLDRCRRDGHRSSRFFMCTPVLGEKRRKFRNKLNIIDIETSVPAAVEELRRWTSREALGDVTVNPDCINRIAPNASNVTDGEAIDGTIASDDEGIDYKLPSPEEQLQVLALKFPAEIVAVDISGKSFDRMSFQRRSMLHNDTVPSEGDTARKRTRTRRPRSKRRNTLAGTDQKEIQSALTAGEEASTSITNNEEVTAVSRSRSSDLLRSVSKKDSNTTDTKKSHFNTLKQWGKSRYDKLMNKSNEKKEDIDDFNLYETVTVKKRKNVDKKMHQRSASVSSSEKSSISLPLSTPLTGVMNIAVRLRESSLQKRERRNGGNKDEPHSSSGNWSASSESGRNSIGSEITTTTQPKSTTSAATSSNSLNIPAPSSVNSRRRFNFNTSTNSSVTSEGTLTPDIIHDLHEDGETSSVYSCDTEGYYTSFHMDSGLKTLKEEELPATPIHSTSALGSPYNTAENEYELFGKGSTSTTTSSAGTVCTTLLAGDSNKSLSNGPAVPERKSSLTKLSNKDKSPESSLERDYSSERTGTVKRSPANSKAAGDVSPDSGHNTSSSPIESANSPNGVRSGSEFEFSESSDMEGAERIERIRVKTTINSSRIPSMCVITPQHSDDESSHSSQNSHKPYLKDLGSKNVEKRKMDLPLRIIPGTNKSITINQQSGYATLESIDAPKVNDRHIETKKDNPAEIHKDELGNDISKNNNTIRSPSPSGGSVIIKEVPTAIKTTQPIFKSTLMPLNNMFGKLRNNLASITNIRRDRSRSPNGNNIEDTVQDLGEYVTIADVRNNNKLKPPVKPEVAINENLSTVLSGKINEQEYISLNDLPCNEETKATNDSLERRKRQGARVTLDAEGKVVYSSDSLRRRKGAHTTFEPGPFVKLASPSQSPLPTHRTPKAIRPVTQQEDCSLTPQLGKLVIKASSGLSSPTKEIIRLPPSTVVSPTSRALSPKPTRGAYVHVQDATTQEKDRVPPPLEYQTYPGATNFYNTQVAKEMYKYQTCNYADDIGTRKYLENQYYLSRSTNTYQTLPIKKPQIFITEMTPERSVTPDITRGLERNCMDVVPRKLVHNDQNLLNQKLGIPVAMPQIRNYAYQQYTHRIERPNTSPLTTEESIRISPIDPRNNGGFQSSTPSNKSTELKAAINLENKLLSPKKSTMSNEELYAVIHKSKKKLNIKTESVPQIAKDEIDSVVPKTERVKSPETGYLGDKARSRLSWSPSKGEYIDFNSDIDKISPTNESKTRQSWACTDKKIPQQTSRLDFKKLLLQKSTNLLSNNTKKLSAVEQLKLSKQKQQQEAPKTDMSILELSGSPRSLINRRFYNNAPGSPRNNGDKVRPPPKILSPRSQWRFPSPRTDVLSSTILEDCREDESPNNSIEKKKSSPVCLANRFGEANKNLEPKVHTNSIEKKPSPIHFTETDSTKPLDAKSNKVPVIESKTYASISQKIQAQRAQFFNLDPPTNSQFDSAQNEDNCSLPALETAF